MAQSSRGAALVYDDQRSDFEIVDSRQRFLSSSEITVLAVKTPEKGFLEVVAVVSLWHL